MKTVMVVCGPSGAGKTEIVDRFIDGSDVHVSVWNSFTSRPRRSGEEDGKPYVFFDRDELYAHIERGEFLEWDEVGEHIYGTLASVTRASGLCVKIMTINGVEQMLKSVPRERVLTVRVVLDRTELIERLRGRGEDEDFIEERLSDVPENGSEWALDFTGRWDVSVYNRNRFASAIASSLRILAAAHSEEFEDEWSLG